jgi:hypothetical protein
VAEKNLSRVDLNLLKGELPSPSTRRKKLSLIMDGRILTGFNLSMCFSCVRCELKAGQMLMM